MHEKLAKKNQSCHVPGPPSMPCSPTIAGAIGGLAILSLPLPHSNKQVCPTRGLNRSNLQDALRCRPPLVERPALVRACAVPKQDMQGREHRGVPLLQVEQHLRTA